MITEVANAKINLALCVKDERADGYHEVINLMCPLELCDYLTFEKISEGIELVCSEKIENNFVLQAAKLFFTNYEVKGGVRITLDKNIPIQAGLAGGSADAAACLRGLNRLFELNIPLDSLAKLSEVLGSDMPYCVINETSICYGRGEIVNNLNIANWPLHVTLIKPSFGLSTKLIYDNYKVCTEDKNGLINEVIEALKNRDIMLLKRAIFNDLQATALQVSQPLKALYDNLSSNYDVYMSGSGPTLFILSEEELELTLPNHDVKIIKTRVGKENDSFR